MISNSLLRKLLGSKNPNVRYTAVNCPVCWAQPGEGCYRMRKGKPVKNLSRRVVPHLSRKSRFGRRIGF